MPARPCQGVGGVPIRDLPAVDRRRHGRPPAARTGCCGGRERAPARAPGATRDGARSDPSSSRRDLGRQAQELDADLRARRLLSSMRRMLITPPEHLDRGAVRANLHVEDVARLGHELGLDEHAGEADAAHLELVADAELDALLAAQLEAPEESAIELDDDVALDEREHLQRLLVEDAAEVDPGLVAGNHLAVGARFGAHQPAPPHVGLHAQAFGALRQSQPVAAADLEHRVGLDSHPREAHVDDARLEVVGEHALDVLDVVALVTAVLARHGPLLRHGPADLRDDRMSLPGCQTGCARKPWTPIFVSLRPGHHTRRRWLADNRAPPRGRHEARSQLQPSLRARPAPRCGLWGLRRSRASPRHQARRGRSRRRRRQGAGPGRGGAGRAHRDGRDLRHQRHPARGAARHRDDAHQRCAAPPAGRGGGARPRRPGARRARERRATDRAREGAVDPRHPPARVPTTGDAARSAVGQRRRPRAVAARPRRRPQRRAARRARAVAHLITAPFAGIVLVRHLDPGNTVTTGTPVYDLADVDPLYVDVEVPERHVARLSVGQAVRLRPDAAPVPVAARIERIAPLVDPATGTVKVTLTVRGAHELRPGAFVRVEIITDTHPQALVVPRSALVAEGRRWYLYRLDPAGKTAHKLEVDLGYEGDQRVEVLPAARGALNRGAQVIVAGAGALSDGAPVEVTTASRRRPPWRARSGRAAEGAG